MVDSGQSSASDAQGAGAPRPSYCITVGVTGHRRGALPKDISALYQQCRSALDLVRQVAEDTLAANRQWFASEPAQFSLLSPLADGADQVAAQAAIDLGYRLHGLLSFPRDQVIPRLHDDADRASFDRLLAMASRILELPGEAKDEAQAYVMTGRATVAHADILLAVWDGQLPRGRGGTAAVVELALRRGLPVIRIDPAGREPATLLWGGFDPTVITESAGNPIRRTLDDRNLRHFFDTVVAAPASADERVFLEHYFAEKPRRFRGRIEYPLLLAVAGAARFDPSTMRESHLAVAVQREWDDYRRDCVGCYRIDPSLDLLGSAYAWSDRLATRFAQNYRSGHIFNFVVGGIAVCLGLVANLLPGFLLQFALAEAIVTALILVNTRVGVGCEWHRRWLDYRQLAERLRPMRSFKFLALAAPDPPGTLADPRPRRWVEWYALAIWRAIGCPTGAVAPSEATAMAASVATYEVAPQIRYHRRHAEQIDRLDRRLEHISAALFWITLVVSLLVVAGAAARPDIVRDYDGWLTLAGAGFPALGTAIFGVRFQADFGGSAVRSRNTAQALAAVEAELRSGVDLDRAAELAEQAGRVMLGDLDEWRLVNQQQELDLI